MFVSVQTGGAITLVRVDRPPANAINLELLDELVAALEGLAADVPAAVVIAGRGGFFSAGVDLKAVPGYGPDEHKRMVSGINRMVLATYGMSCPVIAAVTGHAIAGGLVLALCADLRIASREGRYGLTEVKVGVPYPQAAIGVVRAELPVHAVRNLAFSNRLIDGAEALRLGLFDEALAPDAVLPRAMELARELAAFPRDVFATTKHDVRNQPLGAITAAVASEPLLEGWLSARHLPQGAQMSEERLAVEGLPPDELEQVPEHLEDDLPESAPAAVKPGGPLRFARMTGSSIAGRDAAGWVTDFLNAAYYRRPVPEREVDDLRLAFSVLTTYWYRHERGRRLRITDLGAFHRAFGSHRFDTERSGRGLLTREQLLDGAAALLGDWFPDSYADDGRRGWGIAFPTPEAREEYDPQVRMRLARLGELTPELAPRERQTWHTYPPVHMPSAQAVVDALTRPETWPDYASEIGRFTPLRPGGLAGQTFEIEVAAGTESGRPMFTRGYVTITQLVTPDDPVALRGYFDDLQDGLARYGRDEPPAVPEGAEPVVGFDLTTHQGHFMGLGHNRLILYTHDGRAWVRAVGTWDPMPWHVDQAYRLAGRAAQHAFWGQGNVERLSMLHQLAKRIA